MITLFSSSSSSSVFFFFALLIILPLFSTCIDLVSSNNETDRLALVEFKSKITDDPLAVMASWNHSIHFCSWYGVTCSRHRVITLNLQSNQLSGSLSPHIGNFTFLRNLTIQNNSFAGEIPGEVGLLRRLEYLNLSNNSLVGQIPVNLSTCVNLVDLHLARNRISGTIPPQIGLLVNLRRLLFHGNTITGNIPSSFGNLSSLQGIYLYENHLSGRIPGALGGLKSLKWLELGSNDLEGTIPHSIFNISSLESFSVSLNRLSGSFPMELGNFFPNLWFFGISFNHFTGSIPPSISNASNLESLMLGDNNLTGQVPNLENLPKLSWLSLVSNQLGSAGKREATTDLEFLSTLANNTNLEILQAGFNRFGGMLQDSITNSSFSKLRIFTMESNQMVGTLPAAVRNLESLEVLSLRGNRFSGGIPEDIGKLHSLKMLYLDDNGFTGNIPSSIGNLNMLITLALSENKLQGRIPSSLGKCQNLLVLDISDNNLNGSIPVQIFTISSLSIALDFSGNQLTGALPSQVGNLKSLGQMYASHNMLSGEIPNSIGGCVSMEVLDMSKNLFRGEVPSSFSSLRALKTLNLSHNSISGEVPSFLQSFHLDILDLSFNNLFGILPTGGIFKNASVTSVQGNNMLCGGAAELHLPICSTREPKKRSLIRKPTIIVAIVLPSLLILLALSLLCLWLSKRKSKEIALSSSEDSMLQVQYKSLFNATDGFSETNLIGKGSFSSVYKGILDLQRVVAIKVFDLQRKGASRSFLMECEALRNIRHRNLLKVITVCSSIDFHGDNFKALVYEFMANGNLDQWLHPSPQSTRKLDLAQRLDIVVGVANALNYLHHEHHQTSIIHCDLKPSNILLDDDMIAKVGDFGLMKFLLEETNHLSASSLGLRGTVGYAAPEYGMGSDVSTDGDIYSFGILILEMFTGKRPTDDMFDSNMNIHNYVKQALPEKVADITEAVLVEDDADKVMKLLNAIYEIGVACSEEIPRQRMDISNALAKLIVIRDHQQQQQQGTKKGGTTF